MCMVKEGLRPTTNSNTYDYRINVPSPNAPKKPDSNTPPQTKKRFKPKSKKQQRIIMKYTDTPDDLDLLGHYGSLGQNRLPSVTNTDNVVDHIVDEYKTKLNHPYFKDWH